MTFDYARAWQELSQPAFEALPKEVRDLYILVAENCSEFSQDPHSLDLPWPENSGVHQRFAELSSNELSAAAHIIHTYGHWSPHAEISSYGAGAHWRFSNYADQMLRGRLGLPPRRTPAPSGASYAVVDGFLRACWNDRDSWTWREIGLATSATLEKATTEPVPPLNHGTRCGDYEEVEKWLTQLSELCRPTEGTISKFFDLSRYMGGKRQ